MRPTLERSVCNRYANGMRYEWLFFEIQNAACREEKEIHLSTASAGSRDDDMPQK